MKHDVQVVVDIFLALSIFISTVMIIRSNQHAAAMQREQRRQEILTNYLIDTYMAIEAVTCRGPVKLDGLETAMARIQLLGSDRLISVAQNFMTEFKSGGDTGAILTQLRNELRSEIGIETTQSKLLFFRETQKKVV